MPIAADGTVVHLEGFGLVQAFRIVASNGDTQHWITNDLTMNATARLTNSELAWGIEEYHRGPKQYCGVERCQQRQSRAQRNHIGLSIRAFWRREWHRFRTGVSWFAAKTDIVREAVRAYLANPFIRLPERLTA